ncbi:outer membrane protein assembly factor BamC [Psychromonas sp. RZ22]|uniref:outer membrane protein assembly factor BamC n=1 Tax=Psychromonas algarum TaxID=2555643 RepID=UPI0010676C7D|nr:outer membrane protein assembly factor BamC [Psychromonas sp. RZ22]TEW55219.1 outer membrane protein assembly factor BamC [Psychromonas sp. RZ22]
MNKKIALTKLAGVIALALSVSSCVRFETRTQAEGKYKYLDATLIDKYNTGDFTNDEQRPTYDIQALTEEQENLGLLGKKVDVRPPKQLMSVLEGVLLDPDPTQTKVWFNAFKNDDNIQQTVWDLLLAYFDSKNATSLTSDRAALTINTGPVIREQSYGYFFSRNYVRDEGVYNIQLLNGTDGRSVGVAVDVQNFEELNDGEPVEQILAGDTKRGIELALINDMLKFAFLKKEAEELQAADNKPLPIKLGFDDNHQTAWVIDADFVDAWRKLPKLLALMSFSMVEEDKNLGYFLVDFDSQDPEYWAENNLNPINLEEGEYFVQLGELTGGDTSLIWLDADKQPLTEQQVTDLYLSITSNIRSVTLEKDIQTILY